MNTRLEILTPSIEMPDLSKFVCNSFNETLQNNSVNYVDSVKISSGIDHSVRLIGSHISVLKPYFLEGVIPERGLYMIQPCIRTCPKSHA